MFFFSDLACHRSYPGPSNAIVLSGLSDLTSKTATLTGDSSAEYLDITVEQYFKNLDMKPEDVSNIIKVSFCYIVWFTKTFFFQKCAEVPSIKLLEQDRAVKAWNISADPFFQKAGIKMKKKPLEVSARQLASPKIGYANGQVFPKEETASWQIPPAGTFILPGTCRRWKAVLINAGGRRTLSKMELEYVVIFFYFIR